MKIREYLFKGMRPCSDGHCVIGGKAQGMHTNGGCKCLVNMSRTQLMIVQARLSTLENIEVPPPQESEK